MYPLEMYLLSIMKSQKKKTKYFFNLKIYIMKKVWEFLKNYGLGIVASPLIDKGGDFLEKTLETYYAKNPKACASLVAGLYPFIDTVVEDAAEKTDTPHDDKAVDGAKKELEEFASRHNFVLTNLDND